MSSPSGQRREHADIYPNPEIGGTNKGKIWAAPYKNSKPIVFRIFAYVLPSRSTMGGQNVRLGAWPHPQDIGEKPLSAANFDTKRRI